MWLRELKRYLRSKSRIVGSLRAADFIFAGSGLWAWLDFPKSRRRQLYKLFGSRHYWHEHYFYLHFFRHPGYLGQAVRFFKGNYGGAGSAL